MGRTESNECGVPVSMVSVGLDFQLRSKGMFIFEIANLAFRGAEFTQTVTADRIISRADTVRILINDFECTLQQLPSGVLNLR